MWGEAVENDPKVQRRTNAGLAAPPWALTATLEPAYPMHPMGAQHSHEEEGLGREGLQDGFLATGFITQAM